MHEIEIPEQQLPGRSGLVVEKQQARYELSFVEASVYERLVEK
jgi:hypothetical protein